MSANPLTYLEPVLTELSKAWPDNKTINIVCHGHSVPAGYFATPTVNTFESYPHLLHKIIKQAFPFAAVNIIVTAIGGETSDLGAKRFVNEVLNHNPSVVTIDYGLNDRRIRLEKAYAAWCSMIEKALLKNIKVILLTPSWDTSYLINDDNWKNLVLHAEQIRSLADKFEVGLSDSFLKFGEYIEAGNDLNSLLSQSNHPNSIGHQLIADGLCEFFKKIP
ncbi:MAG: SGNH/GDSL hydrolase family protein [Treponema sp.]|nr:SGNH/GDSL hydrolase family protein [Treponema sp.]